MPQGGGAQDALVDATSPEEAHAVRQCFGAGLVPETQVDCNEHLPSKRPRMANDPDWVEYCSVISAEDENRVIGVRRNAVKYVS
jgi:hypothetical protein